jgi:eukaryotic-like serine/threonine-protein kinase
MQVGAYHVLFELGRGGMGSVHLARSIGPQGVERLVAIKRAREALAPGSEVGDRFLDEVRVTALIHHANVVSVHQAGADERGYYLVFDYVEGESLDGLVTRAAARGERLPLRVVLRIVLDALAGLQAAHTATDAAGRLLGILHRDVSTHNLLVGRDGVTRLSDFGIAKSTLSSAVTEQGEVQGKLVYMAPEYVQKLPVDRTIDVYAMGVTLWVALAGKEPWQDSTVAQILRFILMHGVPPPSSMGIEVDSEIEAIVARACSRDSGFRFQSAREMLDALEAAGKKLDAIASHVEVAEYVESVVGAELAKRREAIRRYLATEPVAAAVVDAATAVPAIGQRRPPWRAAAYAGAALALVVVGVALLAQRSAPEQPKPEVTSTPALSAPAPAPVLASAAVPPAPSAAADAGTPRTAPVRARPHAEPTRSKPPPSRLDQISTANPYQ